MKINQVLVLIELDSGHVHQVLASKEQKDLVVQLLRSDEGILRLSERVEPIKLEPLSFDKTFRRTPLLPTC